MIHILQPSARLDDPHDCTDSADALSILGALFETVVRRDGSGYAPGLAEAWEISQEGRRFDLTLRAGARFADGTPVDAEAVVANLQRMARPDKGYALGSPGVWRQYLGGAEIVAEGPRSVVIHLAVPVADLLDILVQAFIVSPACFEALDAGRLEAARGSGALVLDSVAEGRVRASGPSGTVEWRAESDAEARLAGLIAGEADVAMRLPTGADLPEGLGARDYDDPTAVIYLFNQQAGPLSDPRLRRALHVAVDRPALIDAVLGGAGTPLHGIVSDAHFGAERGTPDPTDPDEARRLLAEAAPDGLHLTVDCPTRLPDESERLTAALARQLARFGVTLDVRLHQDREAYAHMVRRKEIGDMCVFDSSPMSTFRVIYEKLDSRVAGAWWQGHSSPELEACLDRARRTVDAAARAALYREIHGLTRADPPWLVLYTVRRRMGLRGLAPPAMGPDGVLDVTQFLI